MNSLARGSSIIFAPLLLAACGDDGQDSATAWGTTSATSPTTTTGSTSGTASAPTGGGDSESVGSTSESVTPTESSGGFKFDLPVSDLGETGGPVGEVCKVQDGEFYKATSGHGFHWEKPDEFVQLVRGVAAHTGAR